MAINWRNFERTSVGGASSDYQVKISINKSGVAIYFRKEFFEKIIDSEYAYATTSILSPDSERLYFKFYKDSQAAKVFGRKLSKGSTGRYFVLCLGKLDFSEEYLFQNEWIGKYSKIEIDEDERAYYIEKSIREV